MRLATILSFASLAVAAPARTPTLDVKLSRSGNSKLRAVITNNGITGLRLFKVGSILDTSPVEKVKVTSDDGEIAFDGIRLHIATQNLDETHFQSLPAGQSIDIAIDVAQAHDLSLGGSFGVHASGAFSFAEEGSTRLIGSIVYESNRLSLDIDGEAAAAAYANHNSFRSGLRRSTIQGDCTGSRLQVAQAALHNCADVAGRAQRAAASGPADKLIEYFKSSSSQVRDTVSDVFGRVAAECGASTQGVSSLYCTDVRNGCKPNVLAYTTPARSIMVLCDMFFQVLPAVTGQCHAQDQATTMIHESTHLWQMKGADDYGSYGYEAIRSLPGDKNLNHADTYAMFANAVWSGC